MEVYMLAQVDRDGFKGLRGSYLIMISEAYQQTAVIPIVVTIKSIKFVGRVIPVHYIGK